jgi:hypothetical protein
VTWGHKLGVGLSPLSLGAAFPDFNPTINACRPALSNISAVNYIACGMIYIADETFSFGYIANVVCQSIKIRSPTYIKTEQIKL